MSEFSVFYLGKCSMQLCSNSKSDASNGRRSNEEKVIDQIENEQIDGAIAKDCKGLEQIIMRISKYGVHLFSQTGANVIGRIPLVNLVFTVSYDDGFNRFNTIVVEKVRESDDLCCCHLLQVSSQEIAEAVCKSVKNLFDNIQTKCLRFDDEASE